MTGVAMVKSGMSTIEACLMGVLVYAGSSQLAAIPLIAAGAPMWVILATAFCVNLRFMVFSAHLRPYVMHLSRRRRLFYGYLTADMTYVLLTKRFPHPAEDAETREAQEARPGCRCHQDTVGHPGGCRPREQRGLEGWPCRLVCYFSLEPTIY